MTAQARARGAPTAALLVGVVLGCGGPSPPAGALDAGVDSASVVPFVPTPAEPPVMGACAGGLTEMEIAGVSTCEPWPIDAPPVCGEHEARFFGETVCAPIGTPCAADGWPSDLPAGRTVIHVRADAAAGGDGTRAAPLDRIAAAMSRARAGDVIALAVGDYDEPVRLRGGVELWGACVEGTSIAPTSVDDMSGAVTVVGIDAAVRNLRLGGGRPGVWVDGQSVRLDRVEVAGASRFGILVAFGAELVGERVVVRDTRARDGRFGVGVYVSDAGLATLDRIAVEANTELGVVATGAGSVVRLLRASIANTRSQVGGSFGRGVFARAGGRVEVEGAVVERNREQGLLAEGAGSSMALTDVLVRGTLGRERDGAEGRGLEVTQGARVEATRFVSRSDHEIGVVAHDTGSALALTDAVIFEPLPAPDGSSGYGILVDGAATASLVRVVVSTSPAAGMLVRGPETNVSLSDVRIADGVGESVRGVAGHGVEVNAGASLTGMRVVLERNRQAGLIAFDSGTRVSLTDVAVTRTRERLCAIDRCMGFGAGVGVSAVNGAYVQLARFAIVRSASCGAQIVGDASVELSTGEIAECPIGINVQSESVDLRTLTASVTFRDNVRNLDTATLPVPDPAL